MIDRYFELNDSAHNHHKFWEVVLDGTVVNVYFGRIGTKGQCQVKTFPTAGTASAHVSRLIHERKVPMFAFIVPGPTGMLILALVMLLLFGNRMPSVARSLGASLFELKRGVDEIGKPLEDAQEDVNKARRLFSHKN